MFSRHFNSFAKLSFLTQPKSYLISKFCIALGIIVQRAFLITESAEDDRISSFIVQILSLPLLLVSEYLLFLFFSRKRFRYWAQLFLIWFTQLAFTLLFVELSLITFAETSHSGMFLQEIFFLNILMIAFTESKLLRGAIALSIAAISAFRLIKFDSNLYYISWTLMAFIFSFAVLFTANKKKKDPPPLVITPNQAKYSKLDCALEGVALIHKDKTILYMNGLFKGLFESNTDKEALEKFLKLRKFDSFSTQAQKIYLQEIRPKSISTVPPVRDTRSLKDSHSHPRNTTDNIASLEVPKMSSVVNFKGAMSPRPSIFQAYSPFGVPRPSILQGPPSIVLRRGSNLVSGVAGSSRNIDSAVSGSNVLPVIKINLSKVDDEDLNIKPVWYGESDARSPLINLPPEHVESFVSNHPGINVRLSSRSFQHPSSYSDTNQHETGDKNSINKADLVESIVDAIFAAMSRNSDKNNNIVITQLIENMPFPLEILKGRSTTSQSNAKQESTTLGHPHIEKFNVVYRDPQKGTRIYELILSPFIYQQKETLCICIRDVSYEVKAEEIINTLASKDRILRFVSHEFRTPLNCSISLLDVMKPLIPKDVCSKYLLPALNSSKLLLNLANDILDHAQIQARKLKVNISPCKIKRVFEEVIEMMELQASAKKIELKLDWDSRIPQRFYTDPNRLRQILLNLVSNALKYTSKGSITLKGRYDSPTTSTFAVIDTGVGISKENLKLLFKEFGKVQENRHLNPRGVGLGLLISKLISQELGPDSEGLTVQSEEGKGSVFYFTLESKIETYEEDDTDEYESLAENDNNSPSPVIKTTHDRWEDLVPRIHSLKFKNKRAREATQIARAATTFARENTQGTLSGLSPTLKRKITSFPVRSPDGAFNSSMNIPQSKTVENLESITTSSKKDSLVNENRKKSSFFPVEQMLKKEPAVQRSYTLEDMRRSSVLKSDFEFARILRKVQHRCGKPRALLVDDNMFNLTALQAMLSNMFNIQSKIAMDGEVAIKEVIENEGCCSKCKNFKVIFMDVEMPQLNGFETTQILKKKMLDGEISFIPIIGVTGHDPAENRVQCLKSGMNDMIAKPVSPLVLREQIIKWMYP